MTLDGGRSLQESSFGVSIVDLGRDSCVVSDFWIYFTCDLGFTVTIYERTPSYGSRSGARATKFFILLNDSRFLAILMIFDPDTLISVRRRTPPPGRTGIGGWQPRGKPNELARLAPGATHLEQELGAAHPRLSVLSH